MCQTFPYVLCTQILKMVLVTMIVVKTTRVSPLGASPEGARLRGNACCRLVCRPPAPPPPPRLPLLFPLGLIQRPHRLGRWKDSRTEPFTLLLGRRREEPWPWITPSLFSREGSDKVVVGGLSPCHQQVDEQQHKTCPWPGRPSHPSVLSLSWH